MSAPNAGRLWSGSLRGPCSVCGQWFTLSWSKTVEGEKVVAKHRPKVKRGKRTTPGATCAGANMPPASEAA